MSDFINVNGTWINRGRIQRVYVASPSGGLGWQVRVLFDYHGDSAPNNPLVFDVSDETAADAAAQAIATGVLEVTV